MKAGYLVVQGPDCFSEIIGMLESEIKITHKTDIIDGVLFFTEDFSWMNSSNLMIITRVQKINSDPDHCEIEVVSGGGGEGLFSFTWGNEKRRVNKVMDLVYEFSTARNFRTSSIEKSQ